MNTRPLRQFNPLPANLAGVINVLGWLAVPEPIHGGLSRHFSASTLVHGVNGPGSLSSSLTGEDKLSIGNSPNSPMQRKRDPFSSFVKQTCPVPHWPSVYSTADVYTALRYATLISILVGPY